MGFGVGGLQRLQRFDYKRFKAGFRKACAEHGVDPTHGATSFQAALVKAEMQKDLHYATMRQRVAENARRQWERKPRLSEGRGFLHDDGRLDAGLVEKAMGRYWWRDAALWEKQGHTRSGTEQLAIVRILLQCPRLKERIPVTERVTAGEYESVLREVLNEGRDMREGAL